MMLPSRRLCFVIMPFSRTRRCTAAQWKSIFEDLIRPAVEDDPELNYECRRSNPDRGNLVRRILEDLQAARVVIADLTDRNANVFYEMGVRHTLANRTILLAQNLKDLPFDVGNYASHVYDWTTETGRAELVRKLRELLREVDEKPDRPDNPVSDFLNLRSPDAASITGASSERLTFLEEQVLTLGRQVASLSESLVGRSGPESRELDHWLEQRSAGPLPAGYTMRDVAKRLNTSDNTVAARAFVRRLGTGTLRAVESKMSELNRREGGQVSHEEILPRASEFIRQVLPLVSPLEEFALSSVEARFDPGAMGCVSIAADLISLEERSSGGLRFAVGLPGFLALRLLLLMGAKAVEEGQYDQASLVLNEPLEVHLVGGQISHEPIWAQRRLFFPEAFLSYADIPMKHFDATWSESQHLADFFASEETYRQSLVLFLVILALRHADQDDRHFYPGYRLITGARRTVRTFAARLQSNRSFREQVAAALRETTEQFLHAWPARAKALNEAKLGDPYGDQESLFPASLEPSSDDA